MDSQTKKIEISYRTIIFTFLFVLAAWFFYQVRSVLLIIFISIVLTGALNPTVASIEKKGIPRWLSILVLYLILIMLFVIAVAGLTPSLVEQTSSLVKTTVDLLNQLDFLGISSSWTQELGGLPSQILKFAFGLFSNITSVIFVLVITFYILLEHKNLDNYLFFLFGSGRKKQVSEAIEKLENKLGGWVRAQLVLMTVIGLISYIGFKVLGLKYALPLALLAGLLEVIPNIGPTLASVPAILVALMTSPLMALLTAIWCILVQQLENSLIVPKIMQRSVGVNPLVTIIVLATGFKLAGVMGAILGIPVYLTIEVVVSEFKFFSENRVKNE